MLNLFLAGLAGAALITITGFLPVLNFLTCCGVWQTGGGFTAAYAWTRLSGGRSHVPMCLAAGLAAGLIWGVGTSALSGGYLLLAGPRIEAVIVRVLPEKPFTAETLREFLKARVPGAQQRQEIAKLFEGSEDDPARTKKVQDLVDFANSVAGLARDGRITSVLLLGVLGCLALLTMFTTLFSTVGGLLGGLILGEDPPESAAAAAPSTESAASPPEGKCPS